MAKKQYNPTKGEDFFCVPTVLYMILESEGIALSLDEIISDFKYNLPNDYVISHNIKNYEYTTDEKKWGILMDRNNINDFFQNRNLPFVEMYIPINTIAEYNFYEILNTAESNNNHIIFGYDYKRLYENTKSEIGHVSLVSRVISDEVIEIIDPGPKNWGVKQVALYDMYSAIKAWNDGLWVIQRKKE